MTRHEQILSEVQKRFSSNDTHLVSKINAFVDGVKWADKNPKDGMVSLDKVENILEKILFFICGQLIWTNEKNGFVIFVK